MSRKPRCGNLFNVIENSDALHVDSEFTAPGNGQEREVIGMRQIEMERSLHEGVNQGRLAGGAVMKFKAIGVPPQIPGQNRPEPPASNRESGSIAGEAEPSGAFPFVIGQSLREL